MNTANTPSQFTGANQVRQPQIQPGQDLLSSPIISMTTKINDGTNKLTNLLKNFQNIPDQINQLRNKGSGEVAALRQQLNKVTTDVKTESSGYVEGLVKSINKINTLLDGLNTNINSLGSKADEINTALGEANNSTAGGRNSPTSVVSGPGNPVPGTNPVTPVTPSAMTEDTFIPVSGTNMKRKDIITYLNDKIKRTTPGDYKNKFISNKNAFLNAKTVKEAQAAVSGFTINGKGDGFKGGKRSRKIRRKYSKKHSKKLRRSSK